MLLSRRSDFDKICRICLKIKRNMSSLYKGELINKIYESFNIKILDDTNLPNSVCDKCTIDINSAFRLKQLVTDSQKTLADIIKNDEFDEKPIVNNLEIKEENIFCTEENVDEIIKDIVKEELPILTETKDESEDNVSDVDNIEIDNFELSTDVTIDASNIKKDEFNNFKCTECEKSFRHLSKYKRHIDTHIPKTRKYKRAANETAATNSIEKDKFNKYKCIDCEMCFRFFSKYKRHRESHIRKKRRLLKAKGAANDNVSDVENIEIDNCEILPKITPDTSNIERDEFGNYKCKDCEKSYRYLSQYKEHRVTHIRKSQRFYCKPCGRTYNREANLLKHQPICDGSNRKMRKRVLCNQCGKSVIDLQSHIRSKHRTKRPLECPMCHKQFLYPCNLNMHIRHVHEGAKYEKIHLCVECGKAFGNITYLKVHIVNKHMGQKAFKCKLCNAEFCSSDGFRTHMAKHTNTRVRKCPCTVCEKKFYTARDLRNHMRIHTGERPYSCQICQKSFTQNGALHIHMKSHKLLLKLNP